MPSDGRRTLDRLLAAAVALDMTAALGAAYMVHEAQSGHISPGLGAADIVTTLFFETMHVDPHNPEMPDRDRAGPPALPGSPGLNIMS